METAIKRTEGQLHEIELYLVQLREKGEDEKKIEETKTRQIPFWPYRIDRPPLLARLPTNASAEKEHRS